MDWAWLGWFGPLVAGAGLTFFFGWLDGTLKHRRQLENDEVDRALQAAERKRVEGRAHAERALSLASRVRDDLVGKRDEDQDVQQHGQPVPWDAQLIRDLRDVGILIPDPTVRTAINHATNLVTAAGILADEQGWDPTPWEIQHTAMLRLRIVLGAHLRADPVDDEALAWINENGDALMKAWDYMMERDARMYER